MNQPNLFDASTLAVDEAFTTATRTALDAHSWIEVVPAWLTGGEELVRALLDNAPWEQRDRWMYDRMVDEPRLTAEYRTLDDLPHEMLVTIAGALSAHYGVPYDGFWLNLYRNERDSTSWHGDRFSCRRDENVVPVLSLGATRRFHLRPKDGGRSVVITVASGDLVVMGGRCQADWRHCVPKQATPCGPRVSINVQSTWQAGA